MPLLYSFQFKEIYEAIVIRWRMLSFENEGDDTKSSYHGYSITLYLWNLVCLIY